MRHDDTEPDASVQQEQREKERVARWTRDFRRQQRMIRLRWWVGLVFWLAVVAATVASSYSLCVGR